MSVVEVPGESSPNDRRRDERRLNSRLADLPAPEVRRAVLTWLLTAIVVVLFLWMVRRVLIAGILGVVIAAYLRPLYLRILRKTERPVLSAVLTLLVVIVPVLGALVIQRSCRIVTEQDGFGVAHLVFTPSGNAMVVCHGDGTLGAGDQRIELTACRIRATSTTPPLTGEGFAMVTPGGEVIGACIVNPSTD